MKRLLIVPIFLLLTACLGQTDAIILRNAAGMVATCGPYTRDDIASNASAMREAQCIMDYQRQGFERAPR